jgi:hypothetical protein
MSTSDETNLRFVFATADALALKWRQYSVDELVSECLTHVADRQIGETERAILRAMRNVVCDAQSRKGLEQRLNTMNRYASTHPDRDALVTDLGRRALLGELRIVPGDTAEAYPLFSDQLDRIYEGNVTRDDLWRQAWQRTAARLNLST